MTPTVMTCSIPSLNLPEVLSQRLASANSRRKRRTKVAGAAAGRHRRKRQTSGNSSGTYIYGGSGGEYAVVFFGWLFDGDSDYSNYSSTFPGVRIQYFPPPTIPSINDVIVFDSSKDDTIAIQVSHDILNLHVDERQTWRVAVQKHRWCCTVIRSSRRRSVCFRSSPWRDDGRPFTRWLL